MKYFTLIIFILIIFFKTGNLLSENTLFNVNNILVKKEDNMSNQQLSNKAIEMGFNKLAKKLLLKEDLIKISNLNFSTIKGLVAHYNISKKSIGEEDKTNFSIKFDKDKIHDLFYKTGISYSDVNDKEFYILPIVIEDNEIFIFSNNYFYENWNIDINNDQIEFILPLENIEIIQYISKSRDNLLDLDLNLLFKEYLNKNTAIVLIKKDLTGNKKVYLKIRVQNKVISKSINVHNKKYDQKELKKELVDKINEEIVELIKSQNLIDVRTPSFLNVRLDLNKKNNLVYLNSKIKNIDLIENMFVQEFNKDYVNLKLKYLGNLEKIINLLKKEKINLQLVNDEWIIMN